MIAKDANADAPTPNRLVYGGQTFAQRTALAFYITHPAAKRDYAESLDRLSKAFDWTIHGSR